MVASSEGQSFYQSKKALPVGNWTVTVTATHPSPATTTIGITSTKPIEAASPVSAENPTVGVFAVVVPVILAAAALTVAFAIRRRRTRAA